MTDYRYASGEEPRAGDVVRSLKNVDQAPRKIGDVFTIHRLGSFNVWYDRHINGKAESFELIARAGEPVRYQPGDVVECLSWDGAMFKVGSRYEIARRDTYSALVDKSEYGSAGICIEDRRFKLVHRPVTNLEIANSSLGRLVFTLPKAPPEPQVGDRVRVTFEGTVTADKSIDKAVVLSVRADYSPYARQLRAQDKIEIISRAEKPLAVGDEVAYPTSPPIGRISSIDEGKAWVRMHQGNGHRTVELRSLVRVKR